MDIQQCQTQKLLKIIGEERHNYENDVVSDAESVLEHRLGGSREKRRSWDRIMGGVWITLGVITLTLGMLAICATSGIKIFGTGYLSPAVALFVFAVSLAVCGTMVVSGIALIVGTKPKGWLGSVVQMATRHSSALNREGPWPEELIRMIGPERESYSDAELKEAENGIRQLHAECLKTNAHKTRQGAVIGAFFGFVGTLLVVLFLKRWLFGGSTPYLHYPHFPDSVSLLIRKTWEYMVRVSMLLFGLTFPFLLAGSGGLIFMKNWARKMLICVFSSWIIMAMILLVGGLAAVPLAGSERMEFVMYAANAGIGVLFYWLLLRSIRSATLWELCNCKE